MLLEEDARHRVLTAVGICNPAGPWRHGRSAALLCRTAHGIPVSALGGERESAGDLAGSCAVGEVADHLAALRSGVILEQQRPVHAEGARLVGDEIRRD